MDRLEGGFRDLPINAISGVNSAMSVPAGKMATIGIFPLLSGVASRSSMVSPSMPKDRNVIALSPLPPPPASSGVSIHFKIGLEQDANNSTARNAIKNFFMRKSFAISKNPQKTSFTKVFRNSPYDKTALNLNFQQFFHKKYTSIYDNIINADKFDFNSNRERLTAILWIDTPRREKLSGLSASMALNLTHNFLTFVLHSPKPKRVMENKPYLGYSMIHGLGYPL
jgi:hypothetical protein